MKMRWVKFTHVQGLCNFLMFRVLKLKRVFFDQICANGSEYFKFQIVVNFRF